MRRQSGYGALHHVTWPKHKSAVPADRMDLRAMDPTTPTRCSLWWRHFAAGRRRRGSPRRRRRARFESNPTPATARVSTVRPWTAQRSVPPLIRKRPGATTGCLLGTARHRRDGPSPAPAPGPRQPTGRRLVECRPARALFPRSVQRHPPTAVVDLPRAQAGTVPNGITRLSRTNQTCDAS